MPGINTDMPGWIIRALTIILPSIFLAIILMQPWVEPKWMFLDPLTSAEFAPECCPPYFGFVSTLGVMLWTITAAISLFAALIIFISRQNLSLLKFALTAGTLSGLLALDDAFLLHEKVFPAFGFPQNGVMAIYVLLTLAYVIASWRTIFRFDFWILAFGGFAFAASLFIDIYFSSLLPYLVYLEDSAKFIGIVCWTSFHITTLGRALGQNISQPATASSSATKNPPVSGQSFSGESAI